MIEQRFREILGDSKTVDHLIKEGVITVKKMTQYVVRHEYYSRLKKQNLSCFDIKMDISVEYDIPDTTVKNIIYSK